MESPSTNKSTPFKVTGDWKNQTRILQEKYPALTDADMKLESGKEDEMLERMGSRLNKDRAEIINMVNKTQPKAV